MAKPLVIVESPAKARTIAGFLGSDYTVESSIGHIRDLPRNAEETPDEVRGQPWARLGVNVDADFAPVYVIPAGKRKQVAKLRQLMKTASELYLATDEDREGEAIAWHLHEALKPRIPVKRMVFHEITRAAIDQAVKTSRDLDRGLVDAQEARRILDRLYGWEVSEVLWKKVMPRLSAGRVQSVATRLVVEREQGRIAFRSAEYWDVAGRFEARGGEFKATLNAVDEVRVATGKDFDAATGRLKELKEKAEVVLLDGERARALAAGLQGRPFRVSSVESRHFRQQPHPPFITSTLQQEAGRKLRFTASRAMRTAQRLYERGYITYMRTDSTVLSEQALGAAREAIGTLYGPDYLPEKPRTYSHRVRNAQEAHEAIRPAGDSFRKPETLKGELETDEFKLYELVWKRTVASQMADARGRQVSLRLEAETTGGEKASFAASGRTIEFPGFLRAYVEGADDPEAELEDRETHLPPVEQGEAVACHELQPSGHATQPPARFTEASLVKELEARGIGRPSTYASVIQTVQDRGYVWKKGSALVPSWTAFAVVRLMKKHFEDLIDYDFTARMEEDLDAIARREKESVPYLKQFYFGNGSVGLHELVRHRLPEIEARAINTFDLGHDANGEVVALRVGKYGPYVQRGEDTARVADDLPPDELTAELALELLEEAARPDRPLGHDPETGLPVYVKVGRFGPYVQLGELEPAEGKKKVKKPRTASLFPGMDPGTLTLEEALRLLSLPRVVGMSAPAEGGDPAAIEALNGRYGPYLRRGTDSRSLETHDQIFSITLEQAEAIFAQPKRGRGRRAQTVLKELGAHPESGEPVKLLEGRYGPYVTDGSLNASLPRGKPPDQVSLADAMDLLRARAESMPAKRAARGRSKAAGGKSRKEEAGAEKPGAKAAAKKPGSAKKKGRATPARKPAAARQRPAGRAKKTPGGRSKSAKKTAGRKVSRKSR